MKKLRARFKKLDKRFLFAGAFMLIGISTLVLSRAATPTAHFEAESGTRTANATVASDAAASGGQYLKFNSGTGVPAQCASGGAFLWSNLELCGWPGPTNTGPDLSQCPGGVLTNNSGPLTQTTYIEVDNTVINCQNISGRLIIEAQNVTIKNSKVTWQGDTEGSHAVISIQDGASATIENADLDGMNTTHVGIFNSGIKGPNLAYSMVVRRTNIHNIDDGIYCWWWPSNPSPTAGYDIIIEDSYIHDLTQGAANGHEDGFQTSGFQNGTITHNTFKALERPNDPQVPGGGINAAVAFFNDFNSSTPVNRTMTNVTVQNNLFAGGGATIYAFDRSPGGGAPGEATPVGGNEMTNIRFIDNKFSKHFYECVGVYMVWFYRGPAEGTQSLIWPPYYGGPTGDWGANGNIRSGNKVLESGENIDNTNPHRSNGSLCT